MARGRRLGARPRARPAAWRPSADEAIALVAAAQRPDGYINSYRPGGRRRRAVSRPRLGARVLLRRSPDPGGGRLAPRASATTGCWTIAVRAADAIDREFGPARREGIDGHPGLEMALVELTRVTGERRYLALAARMIDLRGRGLLGDGRFGAAYWQDHAPGPRGRRRSPATPSGSSTSTAARSTSRSRLGDASLLAAVRRRWDDLVRTRTYLTGGMGSRHRDEAFGDPYELPPDQAYAETCAAIASVMLALATAARHRRTASTPTRSSGRCTTASCPGSRGRDPVLLRQPAAAADPPGRRAARSRRARALVPVRLLPAEPDAPAELVAAVPGDERRDRASRSTSTPRPRSRPTWPAGRSTCRCEPAYPWDGQVHGPGPRDARPSRGPCRCGCRAGIAGPARRRTVADGHRSRTARGRSIAGDRGSAATR